MEPQLDEVARQRQKHRDARLNQPVPGFPTMTVGQLADEARAAAGAGTAESVADFLRNGGHRHETIENVLRCLDLDSSEGSPQEDAVCSGFDASPGHQRLRMLARLEALLLKDSD